MQPRLPLSVRIAERLRRLVEFVGLPWDAACLEFHTSDRPVLTSSGVQVRRPLSATPHRRWRNYERHLGPLLDALLVV